MMTVRNMTSSASGRKVPNQFVIRDDRISRTTFQSYDSMIATIDYQNNTISLGERWDYSRTTGRYRNQFFEEQGFSGLASTKALADALKTGKYEDDGEVWTIITA